MQNSEVTKPKRWVCMECAWVYDPAQGDPDGGIPPGTPFEEIPEDWMCPICGAIKEDFVLMDIDTTPHA